MQKQRRQITFSRGQHACNTWKRNANALGLEKAVACRFEVGQADEDDPADWTLV